MEFFSGWAPFQHVLPRAYRCLSGTHNEKKCGTLFFNLYCHCQIGHRIEDILTEERLERVALSCRFSLDLLNNVHQFIVILGPPKDA